MTQTLRLAKAASMMALLVGCNSLEPYQRPYSWHQTGVNEANLTVMVANPTDLVHGHAIDASDGLVAAAAVDRLRQNHVKPLADGNGAGNSASSGAAGPNAN